MDPNRNESEWGTALCLLVLAATAAVFWQVEGHDFVNYDDASFVAANPRSATGLTAQNVIWAFTTLNGGTAYYHPLTWLSYQIDSQIFGLRPGPIHLSNLLLHLATTAILFQWLFKLTGRAWRSSMVAGLFALHPLHVETVCWASERKSLVCAVFYMLAILGYIRYVKLGGIWRYLLVVLAMAASLLGKPLAVTLPVNLLLLDFWPLGRLRLPQWAFGPQLEPSSSPETLGVAGCQVLVRSRSLAFLFAEKLPLVALAACGSWLAVAAQGDLGAITPLQNLPFDERLKNIVVAYCMYLVKTIWPVGLSPIYPMRHDWTWWEVLGCVSLLGSVSITVLRLARTQPWLAFGWFWFLLTLVPMVGFVQVGGQGLADRYTYLPLVGIFAAVVWGFGEFSRRAPGAGKRFAWAGGPALLACSLVSARQAAYWRNSIRLFEHAARVVDDNYIARQIASLAMANQNNVAEAYLYISEAVAARPGWGSGRGSLGDILCGCGDYDEGIAQLKIGCGLSDRDPRLHESLAKALLNAPEARLRDPKEAVRHAKIACDLTRYLNASDLQLLAKSFAEAGMLKEAMRTSLMAVNLASSSADRLAWRHFFEDIAKTKAKSAPSEGEGANRPRGVN